jgi:hypothetical protein
MCTDSTDREQFIATPDKEHRFATGVPRAAWFHREPLRVQLPEQDQAR